MSGGGTGERGTREVSGLAQRLDRRRAGRAAARAWRDRPASSDLARRHRGRKPGGQLSCRADHGGARSHPGARTPVPADRLARPAAGQAYRVGRGGGEPCRGPDLHQLFPSRVRAALCRAEGGRGGIYPAQSGAVQCHARHGQCAAVLPAGVAGGGVAGAAGPLQSRQRCRCCSPRRRCNPRGWSTGTSARRSLC